MAESQKETAEKNIYEMYNQGLGGMKAKGSSDTAGMTLPTKWDDATV